MVIRYLQFLSEKREEDHIFSYQSSHILGHLIFVAILPKLTGQLMKLSRLKGRRSMTLSNGEVAVIPFER